MARSALEGHWQTHMSDLPRKKRARSGSRPAAPECWACADFAGVSARSRTAFERDDDATLGNRLLLCSRCAQEAWRQRTFKHLVLAMPAEDFIDRSGVAVRDRLTLLVMGGPNHDGSG